MIMAAKWKQKMKKLYASYGIFVEPICKFLLALLIFMGINRKFPYVEAVGNVFVIGIAALLCSILPVSEMVLCGMIFFVVQTSGISMEVAAFTVVLLGILYIFFIRIATKDSLALLLMPLAFSLKMPCVVPLAYGVMKKPAAVVPAGCGVIIYYYAQVLDIYSDVLRRAHKNNPLENTKLLMDGIFQNKEMILMLIVSVAVMLITYVISKMTVKYAGMIGIGIGAVSYVVITFVGKLFLEIEAPIGMIFLGAVFSALVAGVLEFFLFQGDYTKTEMLQFEDDEYYYYVKAVPKLGVEKEQIEQRVDVSGVDRNIADIPEDTGAPVQPLEEGALEEINLEEELENSLKNL